MAARYELVCVARTPQSAAAPTLVEIGPIVAPTIEWTEQLVGPGSITFSCTADRLESSIRERFRDLDANPTEVWLYRDGTLIAAGPVFGGQLQGGVMSVTAPGLLAYLAYMHVVADQVFAAVDQFTIAATLVSQWQALTFGNFGIVTAGVGTSGVLRDHDYFPEERHQVLQRVLELGAVDDGFDIHVDPVTRALVLSYPQRGADLTGSIVLDARNIIDAGISFSVAPGDLASEALGVATGSGQFPFTEVLANTTLRGIYGRTGITGTFDGIDETQDLTDATQGMLDARSDMLFQPGPGLFPAADADVGDFAPGDTVRFEMDSGLGLQARDGRLASVQVTVDELGTETISVSFV